MIEIKKVDKGYLSCMTCESYDDVCFINFCLVNTKDSTSIRLCKSCRNELKAQIESMDGEEID